MKINRSQPLARSDGDDLNLVALVKGAERYVFFFVANQRAEVLRTMGRFASSPELSFTWYDAATLSQKVRTVLQSTTENRDGRDT